MIGFETAFIIFLIYYAIFTPLFVLLVEGRLKQVENEVDTLLVDYIKLKKRINGLDEKTKK